MQWVLVATHTALLTVALVYRHEATTEAAAHTATRAELTRTQLQAETLRGAVTKQNAALATMKAEQATAEASTVKALTLAQAETKDAKKKAAALLARPLPQGVDACTAASQLFDEVVHAN